MALQLIAVSVSRQQAGRCGTGVRCYSGGALDEDSAESNASPSPSVHEEVRCATASVMLPGTSKVCYDNENTRALHYDTRSLLLS